MELLNKNGKQALGDLIKQAGFVNYEITVSLGCEKGGNFAGVVYKILVTGLNKDGEIITKNFFYKTVFDKTAKEAFFVRDLFLREIKMYDEVLKEMKKLEMENSIKSGFTSFAKCIRTDTSEDQEFLILEDLTKRNLVLFEKNSALDLAHIQVVMKALGKFHALSFALRDQKPKVFQKFSQELPELDFNDDPVLVEFHNYFLKCANDQLVLQGVYKEKWEYFCKNYHKFGADVCNGQLAEPYSVIGHADVYVNNTMFKYVNGVPTEVCLIDWQLARYGSPVLDVVHYLFCCGDRSIRDLHYNTLLNTYYDSLSNFLKELGSNPEKLFPYSAFLEQLKKFGKYALLRAIIIIPIVFNSNPDAKSIIDLANSSSSNQEAAAKSTAILKDVVEEMVEFGYL